MSTTTTVVAVISAGLSQPSSTRLLADRLADAARRAAGENDVEVVTIELRELARDIADNLVTGFPSPRLQTALDAVTGADGVIAVTPVFSASYSGLFKSFIDVLDPNGLAGTPVVVAATGGSARHSMVLDHALRPLFSYLRATVTPTGVFAATADFGAAGDGGADGGGPDPLAERVDRAARELIALLAVPDGTPGPASPNERPGGPAPIREERRRRDTDPFDALVPFEELLARS